MKAKGYSTISGLEKLTPQEIKKRNLELYGSKVKNTARKPDLQPSSSRMLYKSQEVQYRIGNMDPQFHNGDRVLVKYCSEVRIGDIGIFFTSGY